MNMQVDQVVFAGDQSDSNTSTTSGSRDSDSVSVIFNPAAADIAPVLSKPPPVPKKNAYEKAKPWVLKTIL